MIMMFALIAAVSQVNEISVKNIMMRFLVFPVIFCLNDALHIILKLRQLQIIIMFEIPTFENY